MNRKDNADNKFCKPFFKELYGNIQETNFCYTRQQLSERPIFSHVLLPHRTDLSVNRLEIKESVIEITSITTVSADAYPMLPPLIPTEYIYFIRTSDA